MERAAAHRLAAVLAAVLAVAVPGGIAWILLVVPVATGYHWLYGSSLALTALAVGALVWQGLTSRGGARHWRLLMAASFLFVAACAVDFLWYPAVRVPATDILLAQLLLLPVPIFQIPAVLLVPAVATRGRGRVAGGDRWYRSAALDALVVIGALAVMSWDGLLANAFAAPGAGPTRLFFLIGYCAGIAVLVILLVVGIFREPREPLAWALLAAGLVCVQLTGTVYGYRYVSGNSVLPPVGLVGYPLSQILVLAAALATRTRSEARSARVGRLSSWGHAFLPYPFLIGVGVVLVARDLQGHRVSLFDLVACAVLVTLVGTRQAFTMSDNTRLVLTVEAGQQELHRQAFHDSLTGLANRALFRDRLEHAVALQRRDHHPIALLFLDLDGFKGVNDRLGHGVGDQLLRSVAQRLRDATRAADTVARLGGDEFAILTEADDPAQLGRRLVDALHVPHQIDGVTCATGASVGLVVATDPGLGPDALLRQADIAMYAAKARGKGTLVRYRPGLDGADGELEIRTGLALALAGDPAGGTLGVDYQPIVSLRDGSSDAVEALARWTHPTRGPISPMLFVPAAEEAGLIGTLDTYVLRWACEDLAARRAAGEWVPTVHVNVSATRVGDQSFAATVETVLREHGLPSGCLVVEITETGLIPDLDGAAATLTRLAAHGVRIALDDVGVGRTALAALHALPVHILKLDRSLVEDPDDPRTTALRTGLVTLAHSLGMTVVAEGIESAAQREAAASAGCDQAQGWSLGVPGPLPFLAAAAQA